MKIFAYLIIGQVLVVFLRNSNFALEGVEARQIQNKILVINIIINSG